MKPQPIDRAGASNAVVRPIEQPSVKDAIAAVQPLNKWER